ncbi:hypothetical protein ABFS82_05G028700 [Erythranthe guttata]|uniref:Transmembrane protein n=1 Tax=Erythranthe guttata TaxID=4155 RepID=A0A022Q3S4_ERYGU|nr:PREDICTED: uncharacterized protein LOC105974617 [Erythranthe guttata]EYU22621.1 hypothetical protein MIMGU_mgv1a026592mg [Erythranthe guttata]|eukprot:XP_012855184.1 PREDICTED: uncharacterized protein LOC105974617 [Erythranthe guttata]
MVRPIVNHAGAESKYFSHIAPLAIGLFVSVSLLVALCAKHARKYTSKTTEANTPYYKKSPLPSPKQLISALLIHHHAKKLPEKQQPDTGTKGQLEESTAAGLWQKAILMGDKCRPPDFSGVIYYDYAGNRVSEMPMSPRVGPMSPLRNFNFPTDVKF